MVEAVWKSFNSFYTSECCLTIQSSNKVDDMKPYFYKKPCMQISRAAAQNWKQSKCLSKGERINCETARQTILFSQSVQSLSCVWLFATPWTTAHQAFLSITNSRSSPKLMSIESVIPSNHLILCHPLLLPPSIFPSIRVFSEESALHTRWPKYWSFSFNISPSNEHTRLISFRMDWLDLLEVQGTLKSLLQHHSSKASILRSSFFTVQLSHPYMTTGKTIALTRWTFHYYSVIKRKELLSCEDRSESQIYFAKGKKNI